MSGLTRYQQIKAKTELKPGDFAVCKIPGIAGRAIALGQWLIGKPSPVQHAYIYVGEGMVVQAMPGGAEMVPLADAEPAYAWSGSAILLTDDQREDIVRCARRLVGTPYSWLDYLSIGLLRWHIRPKFLRDYVGETHHMICSQLVDFSYAVGGAPLFGAKLAAGDVTPSDLYALIAP